MWSFLKICQYHTVNIFCVAYWMFGVIGVNSSDKRTDIQLLVINQRSILITTEMLHSPSPSTRVMAAFPALGARESLPTLHTDLPAKKYLTAIAF